MPFSSTVTRASRRRPRSQCEWAVGIARPCSGSPRQRVVSDQRVCIGAWPLDPDQRVGQRRKRAARRRAAVGGGGRPAPWRGGLGGGPLWPVVAAPGQQEAGQERRKSAPCLLLRARRFIGSFPRRPSRWSPRQSGSGCPSPGCGGTSRRTAAESSAGSAARSRSGRPWCRSRSCSSVLMSSLYWTALTMARTSRVVCLTVYLPFGTRLFSPSQQTMMSRSCETCGGSSAATIMSPRLMSISSSRVSVTDIGANPSAVRPRTCPRTARATGRPPAGPAPHRRGGRRRPRSARRSPGSRGTPADCGRITYCTGTARRSG